jgi:hypothetical protein
MNPMEARARRGLVLLAAVGALASGCAAANREEYSVMIRKPAHRYRPYTDAELQAMAVLKQDAPVSPLTPAARSELIQSGPQLGPLEAFRPFSYCYRHETDHAAESLVAIPAAPVEYPIALGTTLTVVIVKSAARYLEECWNELFPPTPAKDPPDRPPERPADR